MTPRIGRDTSWLLIKCLLVRCWVEFVVLLLFNADKCKCMIISNKRHVSYTSLALDNQPLQYVQHYKYLGITVSHNLSWTQHIHEICKKARRVLGMIYNKISKNTNDPLITLKLYTALIRPHLEYAAQVWNPYLQKDIQCLERVQQFALRICAKSYTATYEDLLNCFLVPSLRNRRLFLLLCSFYCIINELLYFPQLNIVHPHFSSSRNYNPHAFYVPYARCNNFKCSFVCTAIHLWNSLPLEAQVADNLRIQALCIVSITISQLLAHYSISYCYIVYHTLYYAEIIIKKKKKKPRPPWSGGCGLGLTVGCGLGLTCGCGF